jgi:signal peptidase I
MRRRSGADQSPRQGVSPSSHSGSVEEDGERRGNLSSGRETVESFVTVFLFFLVLGIQAEGFVIPTGSMAPTLMGRHKEATCPQCGLVFAVNADREAGSEAGTGTQPGAKVVAGTCVNCRFKTRIDDAPNFQGDRIYVMKTPLSVPFLSWPPPARLGRWDVAVFKLPEEPEVRYIKRLVGMPGEVVRILRGDIWMGPPDGQEPFHRALRPLRHQDAMQMLVADDNRRAAALADDPRWKRWTSPTGGWTEPTTATYRVTPDARGWSELRYRHIVPDPAQWDAIVHRRPLPQPPRATLITDFYSYNTDLTAEAGSHSSEARKAWLQPHWVGDLTLRLRLQVAEPRGKVRLELVKAGVAHVCEVDLATGLARLARGEGLLGPGVPSSLHGTGTFDLVFTNVDDRLGLRVNGEAPFGQGRILFPLQGGAGDASQGGRHPDAVAPKAADLAPAAVWAEGASVTVSGLQLLRDIYYTVDPSQSDYEALDLENPLPSGPVALFDWLADPKQFGAFARLTPLDFPIAPGRYMMLGDNSPRSRDGRAWTRPDQLDPDNPTRGWDDSGRERWEVPENLLIGKAFCVYWPHWKPFGPTFRVGRDVRLPARPNVENMRWIR